ncbi:flagellar basal body P-ring formation chaperone FlgA [Vibrio sp.]|uniref:flagellar basal body P-ring formation chaperone FlgA n=1 Tax=Vibrio sp. TaxID=678 RepID=UPI003D11A2CF
MSYFKIINNLLATTYCRASNIIFFYYIGILLATFSFSATSATNEQIIAIQQAAEQHILANIEVPPGAQLQPNAANIDSRIKATDCPQGLNTSASSSNPHASNITVLVECLQDNWRVYVPVKLLMSGPQVITANAINKGQVIAAQDLSVSMVELNRFRRQGFTSPVSILGAKAKKNLRSGEILEQGDICVVCRNDSVMIKASKYGMVITTKGTALTDGSLGEHIRVKNNKSNRIIEGIVTDIAEVTVKF